GDQVLHPLPGARRAGGELGLVGERRRRAVLAHQNVPRLADRKLHIPPSMKEAVRMKKSLACALSLAALSLAVPLRAATVYVPVIEPVNAAGAPLATQLWISNFDGVERPYSTTLLPDQEGAEAKAASATVPAKRAVYLDRAAA